MKFSSDEFSNALFAASQAANDNNAKAMNEASKGMFQFAQIHNAASLRFRDDAEAMSRGEHPTHHPIEFYLDLSKIYREEGGTLTIPRLKSFDERPDESHPSTLGEQLLSLFIRGDQLEVCVGDLTEEFTNFIAPQYGRRFAQLWYFWHIVLILFARGWSSLANNTILGRLLNAVISRVSR